MAKYLIKAPTRHDVLSIFAGLRPLAAPKGDSKKTKEISRSHKIFVSNSQLFTMVGGKWTTFRRMAQDMVDRVEKVKGWSKTQSKTKNLPIHGFKTDIDINDPLCFYGTDKDVLNTIMEKQPEAKRVLSERLNILEAQVILAVRYEMAVTVEDFLSRRTRSILFDARESILVAPMVAEVMAKELGKDKEWEKSQVEQFQNVAKKYLLN